MKAVKLTKIQWNLDDLPEEEKIKIIDTLPTTKGFTTEDDFNVVEKVPGILKKKYGYDIVDFSFTECRIVDTVEDLLDICRPKEKKPKSLFTATDMLSSTGKRAKENLEFYVKQRIQLERKGTSPFEMPKILDEVMLGVEKISGLDWDNHTPDELLAPVYRKIWDKRAVNLKDEFEDYEEEDD